MSRMSRRDENREISQMAQINTGFGNGFSFDSGIVVGSNDLYTGVDQGAMGITIPWFGSKHMKIVVGSE